MIRRHINSGVWLIVLLAFLLSSQLHAAQFEVVGSDQHTWFLLPSPETSADSYPWSLAHHGLHEEAMTYRPVRRFGQKPTSQAAHDDTIWLTMPPRPDRPETIPVRVLKIQWHSGLERYLADPRKGMGLLPDIQTDRANPGSPVDLVVTPDGPAVLLSHDSGYSMQRLQKGQWKDVDLPKGISEESLRLGVAGGRLVLLANNGKALQIRWESDEGWSPAFEDTGVGSLAGLSTAGDGLIVATTPGSGKVALALVQPTGLAQLGTWDEPSASWRVVGTRGQVALVRDVGELEVSSINVMTGEQGPWESFIAGSPMGISPWPLILAFGASIVVLLILLRGRSLGQLAQGLAPLAALPRLMALWIDAIPGLIVVMGIWGARPGLLMDAFLLSLDARGWGLYAILVVMICGWSLFWELIFLTSIGKALMGGHLCMLDGARPRRTQLILRTLIKGILLLFPVLMITALRPPALQSAADQATGVVVARRARRSSTDNEGD